MKIDLAIKIVTEFQKWRRGESPYDGDTPETLQIRVMEEAEWIILPQAVETVCRRLQEEKNV